MKEEKKIQKEEKRDVDGMTMIERQNFVAFFALLHQLDTEQKSKDKAYD